MSESEDEYLEARTDLSTVHDEIEKRKFSPATKGMFVSGWDDPDADDGVESNENYKEFPEKYILWAAEEGKVEIVTQLLAENPALVHSTDDDGYTPLHRAAYSNHLNVINVLLRRGAKVSARTNLGWTPLHSACNWNNYKVVHRLLAAGADINARTEGDQTPLHIAASVSQSRSSLITLLMHPEIDVTALNNCGETAYELAKRSGIYCRLFEMAEPEIRFLETQISMKNPCDKNA